MPVPNVSPTKGAAVNISADGAVTVVVYWTPGAEYPGRPSDLFTRDGDRLDWQTVASPDVGRIVKTVMENLSFNPDNGPITIIEAPSD